MGELYTPSQLAEVFHQFPHINITFHFVDPTFNVTSTNYIEALGILASVPAAWLILTLLVLLLYLLTRCCAVTKKRRNFTALKWTLGVLAVVCCGALGTGLYGNHESHDGALDFITTTKLIDDTLRSVKHESQDVEDTLRRNILPLIGRLGRIVKQDISNRTAGKFLRDGVARLTGNVSASIDTAQEVNRQLDSLNLKGVPQYTRQVEAFRWPITMAVSSLLLLFCLLLVIGLIRHSRGMLIMFSVLGLISIILCWLMASVYVATSVALGDFCVSPDPVIRAQLRPYLPEDVITYYLNCTSPANPPFRKTLEDGLAAIRSDITALHLIRDVAAKYFAPQELNPVISKLDSWLNQTYSDVNGISALLDCQLIQHNYLLSLVHLCESFLFGLMLMLASVTGAGILFTCLVCIDSHVWIYIRKRRDYLQVDEQDPFLPPSLSSSRRAQPSAPNSYQTYGPTTSGYSSGSRTSHTAHTPPYGSLGSAGSRGSRGAYPRLQQFQPFPTASNGRVPRDERHTGTYPGRRSPPPSVSMLGPNNGQYATLSKQCKTLESADFY